MPDTVTILRAIHDSNSTMASVLKHLPGRPMLGERAARQELSDGISALEALELITVQRDRFHEPLSLSLTDLGRERLEEANQEITAQGARLEQRRKQLGIRR